MIRMLVVVILLLLPATPLATAEQHSRDYSDMPVMVLYCDTDPGRINPGGGKEPSPESLITSGECTAAEGVSLTFVIADNEWDFEKDDPADEIEWDVDDDAWFARCDIAADGTCTLNSPVGLDVVIGVVLHENTVKPGYTPAFFPATTHNFSEFAGYGLVLIPAEGYTGTATDVGDHQTLALNITHNDEPGTVLTEWEFNDEDDDIYLATNTDGWVSNVIAADDRLEIELVNVDDDADVTIGCSGVDDPTIAIDFELDDDNDLVLTVPTTDSDIRCDLIIND